VDFDEGMDMGPFWVQILETLICGNDKGLAGFNSAVVSINGFCGGFDVFFEALEGPFCIFCKGFLVALEGKPLAAALFHDCFANGMLASHSINGDEGICDV
jgi:hypothetical protein